MLTNKQRNSHLATPQPPTRPTRWYQCKLTHSHTLQQAQSAKPTSSDHAPSASHLQRPRPPAHTHKAPTNPRQSETETPVQRAPKTLRTGGNRPWSNAAKRIWKNKHPSPHYPQPGTTSRRTQTPSPPEPTTHQSPPNQGMDNFREHNSPDPVPHTRHSPHRRPEHPTHIWAQPTTHQLALQWTTPSPTHTTQGLQHQPRVNHPDRTPPTPARWIRPSEHKRHRLPTGPHKPWQHVLHQLRAAAAQTQPAHLPSTLDRLDQTKHTRRLDTPPVLHALAPG